MALEEKYEGQVFEIDGVLYNEDGEVVGLKEEFQIDSVENAEKVMRWMWEADMAAEDCARRIQILTENLTRIKKGHENRRKGLEYRFGPELQKFAQSQLGKTKTWRCPYGSVSFRSKSGGLRVGDQSRALEWAGTACPEAVKVERKFLISQVPDGVAQSLMSLPSKEREKRGFYIEPESEAATIKTGGNA